MPSLPPEATEDEGDSERSMSVNLCLAPAAAALFVLEFFKMGTGEGLASILGGLTDLIAPVGLRAAVAKETMTVSILSGRRLG